MTKPNKETAFEKLGYGKWDAKPEYDAYSLLRTKEGWVVFKIRMRGLQVADVEVVCQPTVRALALEQYRILVGRSLSEGA